MLRVYHLPLASEPNVPPPPPPSTNSSTSLLQRSSLQTLPPLPIFFPAPPCHAHSVFAYPPPSCSCQWSSLVHSHLFSWTPSFVHSFTVSRETHACIVIYFAAKLLRYCQCLLLVSSSSSFLSALHFT